MARARASIDHDNDHGSAEGVGGVGGIVFA